MGKTHFTGRLPFASQKKPQNANTHSRVYLDQTVRILLAEKLRDVPADFSPGSQGTASPTYCGGPPTPGSGSKPLASSSEGCDP